MAFKIYKGQSLEGLAHFDDSGNLIDFNPAIKKELPRPKPIPKGKLYNIEPSQNLIKKLKSILKDNKALRFEGSFKRGKLIDTRKLVRAVTGNYKIFKRQNKAGQKDYNVVIAVDVSGSMTSIFPTALHKKDALKLGKIDKELRILSAEYTSGKLEFPEFLKLRDILTKEKLKIPVMHMKYVEMAGIVSYNLIKAFDGIGINFAVIDFNHTIEVKKDFNQPLKDDYINNLVQRASSPNGRCNHDGQAITKAMQMLKDKDGHNIIITFSDGEPADCSGDGHIRLKKALRVATRFNDVIGIGIHHIGVKRYYKNTEVITNPMEFEQSIIKQLKRVIKSV